MAPERVGSAHIQAVGGAEDIDAHQRIARCPGPRTATLSYARPNATRAIHRMQVAMPLRGIIRRSSIGPDGETEQWVAHIAEDADMPYVVLEKHRHGDHDVLRRVPGGRLSLQPSMHHQCSSRG